MDSNVGALSLSYYYSLKTKQDWTPIVNCNRQDFKLRAEIYKHVIQDCNIDMDELLFWDEFITLDREITEIALIDHNMLDHS